MATARSVAIQREATLARIAESVEDLGGGDIVPKSGSKGDPELKQLIAIADALESIPAAETKPEVKTSKKDKETKSKAK